MFWSFLLNIQYNQKVNGKQLSLTLLRLQMITPFYLFFSNKCKNTLSYQFLLFLFGCLINSHITCLLFLMNTTRAAVPSVSVAGLEISSTTHIRKTLLTKETNFAMFIHLEVVQDSHLNLAYSWKWCQTSFLSATTVSTPDEKGQTLLEHHKVSSSSSCLSAKNNHCWGGRVPALAHTFSIVSQG